MTAVQSKLILKPTPVKLCLGACLIEKKRENAKCFEYQFKQPYSLRNLSFIVIKTPIKLSEYSKYRNTAIAAIFEEPREWRSYKVKKAPPGSTRTILKLYPPEPELKTQPRHVLSLISLEYRHTIKTGARTGSHVYALNPLFTDSTFNCSRTGAHGLICAVAIAEKLLIVVERVSNRGNRALSYRLLSVRGVEESGYAHINEEEIEKVKSRIEEIIKQHNLKRVI